jgi:hypothetical protein
MGFLRIVCVLSLLSGAAFGQGFGVGLDISPARPSAPSERDRIDMIREMDRLMGDAVPHGLQDAITPKPVERISHAIAPPAVKAEPKPAPATAAAPTPPSQPVTYRLQDAAGWTWTDTDPTNLRRWIDRRNRELSPAATYPVQSAAPAASYGGGCASGNCSAGYSYGRGIFGGVR